MNWKENKNGMGASLASFINPFPLLKTNYWYFFFFVGHASKISWHWQNIWVQIHPKLNLLFYKILHPMTSCINKSWFIDKFKLLYSQTIKAQISIRHYSCHYYYLYAKNNLYEFTKRNVQKLVILNYLFELFRHDKTNKRNKNDLFDFFLCKDNLQSA